jgi:hypothetical protein
MNNLTDLQEWNRWAEEGRTVIETLTELNNRYRELGRELNELKAERLKLHESLAKAQLASVPLCIGRPIIDILAKEGQWISESGQGVVAADDLFRNSPYDALDEAKADADALAHAIEYTIKTDAILHPETDHVGMRQALEIYLTKYPPQS